MPHTIAVVMLGPVVAARGGYAIGLFIHVAVIVRRRSWSAWRAADASAAAVGACPASRAGVDRAGKPGAHVSARLTPRCARRVETRRRRRRSSRTRSRPSVSPTCSSTAAAPPWGFSDAHGHNERRHASITRTGAWAPWWCSVTGGCWSDRPGTIRCVLAAAVTDGSPTTAAAMAAPTAVVGSHDMDNTYADDRPSPSSMLDLKQVVLVGHSTGGGEVGRYIGRHGTGRVARPSSSCCHAPTPRRTPT